MLDITAFSNALRHGTVSFLDTLKVRPFVDRDDVVVSISGEDAVVFPLVAVGSQPQYALRLPLEHGSERTWPIHYADLVTAGSAVEPYLPAEITILDVEDIPGVDVALLHDWVPGETLTARIIRSRARHDRDRLVDLLWPLADIANALRVSGMVHGDIAPGNIIVRPDGGMTLIDLDRMGYRDASDVRPRRRAGYRLPRAGGSPTEEDAYALLVLMTTCGIVADSNVHVDHERASEASHPVLLFSSWDLLDLQRSRLVRDIEDQLSPLTRELLELLVTASNGRSERVPDLLRDAIRHVRRHGPRPMPSDVSYPVNSPDWHPIAPSTDRDATVVVNVEAWEVSTETSVVNSEASWPHPEPEPVETIERSTSPPADDARRSAEEIVETLRALVVVPQRGSDSRRAARAERRRQEVANQLRAALTANDRDVLVRLAMSGSLAELGDSDRSELVQVVRALAHESISRAIATDDDGVIVAAVDESVFEQESDLDPAFRDRVGLARVREGWVERILIALREQDGSTCAALLRDAPLGAMARLPQSIRQQATRLATQWEAEVQANAAIRNRDADALAQALGRLVQVRPLWADRVDLQAVVALLGEEQIEDRLVGRLADGSIEDDDQWMVDVVIQAGRLPEVTRLAGLTPTHVNAMIYGKV